MRYSVYCTRKWPKPFPELQPSVPGELLLGDSPFSSRAGKSQVAALHDERGNAVLLPLHSARVLRMTEQGVMIVTGYEIHNPRGLMKSKNHSFQQVWWCIPSSVPDAYCLTPLQLRDLMKMRNVP